MLAFLDGVLILLLFALLYFVGYPALRNLIVRKRDTSEDAGEVEKAVDSAVELKKKAEEEAAKAKTKADDLLHKAEDLRKKL